MQTSKFVRERVNAVCFRLKECRKHWREGFSLTISAAMPCFVELSEFEVHVTLTELTESQDEKYGLQDSREKILYSAVK